MSYKPDDHNCVSPCLVVEDAAKTIAFLEAVFGGAEVMGLQEPGAGVMHAEVRIGDSIGRHLVRGRPWITRI